MALNREAILAAQDLLREEVDVPMWGGTVWIRGLSGEAFEAYQAEVVHRKPGKGGEEELTFQLPGARAKLLVRCCENEDGSPMFTEVDVAALQKKSSKALDLLFVVAQRLSGIERKGADAVAAAAGKSEAIPSDDSPIESLRIVESSTSMR